MNDFVRRPAPSVQAFRPRRSLQWLAGAIAIALLAGCSILKTKPEDQATIYAPDPRVTVDPGWPSVDWQLAIAGVTASGTTDSLRIAVRPSPNELQVYKGAHWSKPPPQMIEDALLRTLEDSGKIPAVARQGSGIRPDYKLLLDLRTFESVYTATGAAPTAAIEVNAKLLHQPDQRVAASRTFRQDQAVSSTAVEDVVVAFEEGLQTLTRDLAGWILESGDRHGLDAHPRDEARNVPRQR